MHFSSEQFHAINIERLSLRIFFTHENFAFQAHKCRCRRRRHTVLPGSRFGDDTGLAHLFG